MKKDKFPKELKQLLKMIELRLRYHDLGHLFFGLEGTIRKEGNFSKRIMELKKFLEFVNNKDREIQRYNNE